MIIQKKIVIQRKYLSGHGLQYTLFGHTQKKLSIMNYFKKKIYD